MKRDEVKKYNAFRKLCLSNSEDALKAAELLLNQNLNHIAYHLSVLALEEIGKIFICFYNYRDTVIEGENAKISLDDHVKKLFWAIWAPSITEEKITKQQIEENRNMASQLHTRRLEVLYTDLDDSLALAQKVSKEEAVSCFRFAKARLDLSKIEGEIQKDMEPDLEMEWFSQATNDSKKRNFVFCDESQEKLIELGNIKLWISWLKEHFKKEETDLKEILENELKKAPGKVNTTATAKWKMKFKIVSQSHSIRQNILKSFNDRYEFAKLSKGSDNNTLIIEAVFGNNVHVSDLWTQEIVFGKLFV